jgi:hypothetical protein
MDAFHEKRMAMLEAQQKRMMACLGQTEANTEKIDPEMMQSTEEHQDVPNEDVAVMPVGEPRKRCRVRKSTAGRCREPMKQPRKLWIPEEVGCRLHEGIPPCSSGMAKKETPSENWDPRNLWTAQGVGHRNEQP